MTLKAVLEITGYSVAVAHDGAEAVALAAEFLPALILMDIGMPVLNGYDACRRIRDQPSGRDIVIIALTGWGQEEDRASSADAGFDHHLVKPVDLALTQKLISNSLASRRWRSAE
jgi:CheY-like chemotaxis protein